MSDESPSSTGVLSIQIMDMGQGDGIYIEFPNGKNMLVDFGSTRPTKGYRIASTDAISYLRQHTRFKKQGQTLDYLVITHPDADHYSRVPLLLDEFKPVIRYLLISGTVGDYKGAFKTWLERVIADNQSTPVANGSPVILRPPQKKPFLLWQTDQVLKDILTGVKDISIPEAEMKAFGGVAVAVLAMDAPAVVKTSDHGWVSNTRSIVLWLRYAGRSICLAGDATRDTEDAVMAAMKAVGTTQLKAEVLKVGHHGSARTSNQPAWVQWLKPEFVFFSSDRHGSLDEDVKTQYRLPQELCVDLIRTNTTLAKALEHGYVSSYDPNDYAEYRAPGAESKGFPLDPSTKKGLVTQTGASAPARQWYQATTTEAVFSTMAVMDARSPDDGSEADQGVQYGIYIWPSGVMKVYSTLKPNEVLTSKQGL